MRVSAIARCPQKTPGLVHRLGQAAAFDDDALGERAEQAALAAAASLLGSSPYRSIDDRDGAILATIPGVPPRSLPSTVILDSQGRIAVRIIGPVLPGQLEGVLEQLVAEGA